jgi:hypothetical protein
MPWPEQFDLNLVGVLYPRDHTFFERPSAELRRPLQRIAGRSRKESSAALSGWLPRLGSQSSKGNCASMQSTHTPNAVLVGELLRGFRVLVRVNYAFLP